ncbi:MAG: triphosphoribosyl-dephospho-CoA synthase [Candidatus Bathyarchaeia archaeon]
MRHGIQETANHVAGCLQLAILLEVSAHKPGNVNRAANFQNTRYEHFLASAVAVEPPFAKAACQGVKCHYGKIAPSQVNVGEIIKDAVIGINRWQHGGNTLLGTIILLSPIAVAAGMAFAEKRELSLSDLRGNVKLVVESTTPADAVAVYDAINLANPNGLVDKAPTLDVNDPDSKRRIMEEGITLHDVFKISAAYDSISKEIVENYPLTFDTGYPYFTEQLEETGNVNTAVIHAFLKILSANPDTLITRKVGPEKAREVSEKAKEVLNLGGLATNLGSAALDALDVKLRTQANWLNPGTTADIIAAVLAISILSGYRP